MYNAVEIERLITLIQKYNGIADKERLARIVQSEFELIKDRKVYSNEYFTIRFSKAESRRMSNTVISLSKLQKYDEKPFIVCIVATETNYLLLANTTFLKKISHSSQKLRTDNIKGSFNGSDIELKFQGIENEPENFRALYAYHEGMSFKDNLERLVESTNGIVGRVKKYEVTPETKELIYASIGRAAAFIQSECYSDLLSDLSMRVARVQGEIAIAALIDNGNIRGRVIEYLITDNGSTLKNQIIAALRNKEPLPQFKTEDKLGDYSKEYENFRTATDIKTKIMFLDGNPKAYNIDKFLEFSAQNKSVYMIYLIGIGANKEIIARLCSVYDERLVASTNLIYQWAGRGSRGVAQFIGRELGKILTEKTKMRISEESAREYVNKLIQL